MTTRTLAVGLRALLVIGAMLVAARGQSGFQTVLPPDTLVFVGVDDTSGYGEELRSSPLGKLWNDPACAELRTMVAEQIAVLGDEAEMALGVDVLRLPALFDGPVAFALLGLDVAPGSEQEPSLSFCVLADVGAHADEARTLLDSLAERLLAGQQGIVRSATSIEQTEVVTFLDSRVDEQSGSRVRYALQASVAVVLIETGGLRGDALPSILARLKAPAAGGPALAGQPAFAQSLAGASGHNVRVWADLGTLIERSHPPLPPVASVAAVASATADAAPDAVAGEETPEVLAERKAERQLTALGVRDLGVFSMRAQCGPKGSYVAARLDWPGDGWIPRLMRNFFQPGEFPRLRYVPVAARGVDALRLDLTGLFDGIIKLLIESGEQSPAQVVAALRDAEEFLGFDPRDDLLELFDGEFVFVSGEVEQAEALPTLAEALNVALIAGLADAEQFRVLLDEIIRRRGLHVTHKTEEFEGLTIHYQSLLLLPVPICYAIVDDMLVLSGAPSLVRQIVHQRNTPEAPSITALPAYREAVAGLRPGYGLLGYSDAAADMKSLLRFLDSAPEMFGEDDHSGVLEWLAQVPLPDESVVDQYFRGGTATAFTVDRNGLYFESSGP